jgi:deoxyribodipyrimidine photo-lyase
VVAPQLFHQGRYEKFTVLSRFKRAWFELEKANHSALKVYDINQVKYTSDFVCEPNAVPDEVPGFQLESEKKKNLRILFPDGEVAANGRLQNFLRTKVSDYKLNRDLPSGNHTSILSPYLASGVISAKFCIHTALTMNNGQLESGNAGIVKWIDELIWREFFKYILYTFPHVCMDKPLNIETIGIKWNDDEKMFQAWKDGRTGYPIVDAAMRELKQTGWLHNRPRQIVASFLTKDLLINWQRGEEYFMLTLIDADFASNNGTPSFTYFLRGMGKLFIYSWL